MAEIDVLLPVKNGVTYLAESVESIRAQTLPDWRLLVLDHGSSDGSLELAYRYAEDDRRIEVHSLPQAIGLAGLLNVGLSKCDCRYVLRQDADDISIPNRMQLTIECFDDDPKLVVVASGAVVIDSAGQTIGALLMPKNPAAITAAAFFYNPVIHPTVAMSFSKLSGAGWKYGKDIINKDKVPFTISVRQLAEDYMLFAQLALIEPCRNIAVPLIKYRRHRSTVGALNGTAQIALSLKISQFLAKSFCSVKGVEKFDPTPFCNHADYVFDLKRRDYSIAYHRMANALAAGLGRSPELERELAFRWVLTTRDNARMMARYLQFESRYGAMPKERRTVRNWLLRKLRGGKYVYDAHAFAGA